MDVSVTSRIATAETNSALLSSKIQEAGSVDLVMDLHCLGENNGTSDLAFSLATSLGLSLAENYDACCFFTRPAPRGFRVLTTHGLALVGESGIQVCQRNCPQETKILIRLQEGRNRFLIGKKPLPNQERTPLRIGFPFADINGRVLLVGDLSQVDPSVILALRKIFLDNRAQEVLFATVSVPKVYSDFFEVKGVRVLTVAKEPLKCA